MNWPRGNYSGIFYFRPEMFRSATDRYNLMDLNEESRAALKQSLAQNGYCVVPKVLAEEVCDKYMAQYKSWLDKFPSTKSVVSRLSLVKDYAIGHSEAAWAARLAAKTVFAAVWDTEKLLTSIDAVAIAKPPREEKDFDKGKSWLHCDQCALRQGLHAYQGAVNLEAVSEDGYCLRVLEKSHNFHQLFFNTFPTARKRSIDREFYKLTKEQAMWYKNQGCKLRCVAVPKGGMVLWDSRVIHDNRLPTPNCSHPDRWRFVSFVCMTPAIWASKRDLEKKRTAYNEMLLTNHWASQKMRVLSNRTPHHQTDMSFKDLPTIARSFEARQLAGVESYDFDDGEPNGKLRTLWLKN